MPGNDARDHPPTPERRPQRRRRVLLGGLIAFLEGAQHFDCTIRDVTNAGARISLPRNQPIPSTVYLINMRDRTAHEAGVAWNSGKEAGLSFLKSYPLNEITDPKLSFLKQLWHARAMR